MAFLLYSRLKLTTAYKYKFLASYFRRNYSTKSGPVQMAFNTFLPSNSAIPFQASPIVIMHGLMGTKRNWKSLAKLISDKSRRKVYTVDARNHGDSPFSSEMSYYDLAEDILLFLKNQSIEQACLIGHSMGGRAVMTVALSKPEVVEKLFVLDISPCSTSNNLSLLPKFVEIMLHAKIPPDLSLHEARKYLDKLLQPLIKESFLRTFLLTNLVQNESNLVWKVNLESIYKNFLPHLSNFPPAEKDQIYNGEAHFIGGQLSDYIKYSDHDNIRNIFPRASFSYIEGAGHWLHSEKPQEFLDLLIPLIS